MEALVYNWSYERAAGVSPAAFLFLIGPFLLGAWIKNKKKTACKAVFFIGVKEKLSISQVRNQCSLRFFALRR